MNKGALIFIATMLCIVLFGFFFFVMNDSKSLMEHTSHDVNFNVPDDFHGELSLIVDSKCQSSDKGATGFNFDKEGMAYTSDPVLPITIEILTKGGTPPHAFKRGRMLEYIPADMLREDLLTQYDDHEYLISDYHQIRTPGLDSMTTICSYYVGTIHEYFSSVHERQEQFDHQAELALEKFMACK